jgi:pimeloyl-ACP methyl ester carboxylesterase
MLIGSPMDASGFGTLAARFADRTVVTYDPRGTARREKTDAPLESTREQHADDIHRIIAALGAGPVDLFATSGGAVNAFALVAAHPEEVRTLVAHEPPTAHVLPDREQALAATENIRDTYQSDGFGPAMAKFIALVGHQGPMPADFAEAFNPDPAMFGLPAEDDGRRSDALVGQNIITCTPLRARLRRAAHGLDEDRRRHRRRVGGPDGAPRRRGRRRAARQRPGRLPRRPRRVPRRRVRPTGRPRRLRREAARGVGLVRRRLPRSGRGRSPL